MGRKPRQPDTEDEEARQRRAREERDRAAGNPTAEAEHMADEKNHEEMSPEEKLQERIDDLMRRTP
jgi:hypothetical protein